MSKEKSKSKAGVDPYPPVDVCCGGTIPLNQNYVPFTNGTGAYQTVSGCSLFSGVAVRVPPTSGTPHNVPITSNPLPTAGNYSYSATCSCPNGSMPVIRVQ